MKIGQGVDPFVLDTEVVELLRRQHRAYVRMVKKDMREWSEPSRFLAPDSMGEYGRKCRAAECADLLEQFKGYAR